MNKAIVRILLIAAILGIFGLLGCSSDEVEKQVEHEKHAIESGKKSLEDKPIKHVPVGNPFPTVPDNSKQEPLVRPQSSGQTNQQNQSGDK